MKTQIHPQRQLQLLGDHERGVDGADPPVEDAYKNLEGRGADGEQVLEVEEVGDVEDVRDEGSQEGEGGGGEAEDCQVLEVPAVCGGDWVGILD